MSASLACWRAVRCSGFFQSAKRAPFQVACELRLTGAAGLVPDLAPDLVERLRGQLDHVERIDAADRVRAALGDRAGDPSGHLAGNQGELLAALVAQRVEERLHRLAVASGDGPHQPPRLVVDDDSQVALADAMRDLVDPDPPQPGEQVELALRFAADALADPAHSPPGDPQQLSDGAPRAN